MALQQASAHALPPVLNASRQEDLRALWAKVRLAEATEIDGSAVSTLDSAGLTLLLEGLDALDRQGFRVVVRNPGPSLRAARRLFRLADRLPFAEEPEEDRLPESAMGMRLGDLLVSLGQLREDDLARAIQAHQDRGDAYLGQTLVDLGMISESTLARVLGMQHGMPMVEPIADGILDVALDLKLSITELRVHGALPLLRLGDTLAVALKDPADVYALDSVRRHCGLSLVTAVASPSGLQAGLDLLQRAQAAAGKAAEPTAADDGANTEERLNEIVINAIIEGASDIHIEPRNESYLLRYRVDGDLHDTTSLGRETGSSLTARIKVMAGMDISEKRLPQDGRIHFKDRQRDVDLRVNTLPTVYGEKTVMRILDRTAKAIELSKIGLKGNNKEWLLEGINQPHGMVLVTGPTGSGKTTTLYSVLDEIVTPEINVSTVENPVERSVDGVNQTQVNAKSGLSFALCLRALLRQDPDVIMIGEIRDRETAMIAVEAAQTGHLVLATLHTNDAPGAATRLIQMGVEPFLVASTLRTVMAQRLVRKLCDACKRPHELPANVLRRYATEGLKPDGPWYASAGCPACRNTGYDGRRAVFEVMRVDSALQDLIGNNPSSADVRTLALKSGMTSLLSDALDRVNVGITSLEEAIRAAGTMH